MSNQSRSDLEQACRDLRRRYDALSNADRAVLRRCKDPDDVRLEGAYWRVGGELARERRDVAALVVLFPFAAQARSAARFTLGAWLRRNLVQSENSASLRFRRLVQSRDRNEVVHRLRALLRLASRESGIVDWGVLGADIMFFGDGVRRAWTQDFFAALAPMPSRSADEEMA